MKSRSFRLFAGSSGCSESGAFLVLVALLLVTLLLVIGLAVDGANLYYAQLRLQRSTDAAAIAGARLLRDGDPEAIVIPNVQQMFQSNLAQMGYTGDLLTTPDVQIVDDTQVVVNSLFTPRLWLMNSLVPGGDTRNVRAQAASVVSPVIVSIVVDSSSSMNCPANGTCGCDFNPIGGIGCPSPTRMDQAKNALQLFGDLLREDIDSIALVQYSLQGRVILPVRPEGGFDRGELIDAITNFPVGSGGSNMQEGIELGIQEIQRVVAPPDNAVRVVVLLSDGATNGSRIRLMPDSIANLPLRVTGRTNYDYYLWQYGGAWFIPQLSGNSPKKRPWAGQGAFFSPAPQPWPTVQQLNSTQIRINELATITECGEVAELRCPVDTGSCDGTETRHVLNGSPGMAIWKTLPLTNVSAPELNADPETLDSDDPRRKFQHLAPSLNRACLTDYRLQFPNDISRQCGPTLPLTMRDTARLHYYSAICEADYAREQGILVYTIATGTPLDINEVSTDAYNNPFESDPKPFLLRRLAADSAGIGKPDFPGIPTISDFPEEQRGRYFLATDATNIEDAMASIAEQIKYRLTR